MDPVIADIRKKVRSSEELISASRASRETKTRLETAAKERIEAIIDCPSARGREELAKHLAFRTSLPVSIALMALQAADVDMTVEQPDDAPKTLAEEMRGYVQPKIGIDPGPKAQDLTLAQRGELAAKRLLGKA
jgi:hypothetical protein